MRDSASSERHGLSTHPLSACESEILLAVHQTQELPEMLKLDLPQDQSTSPPQSVSCATSRDERTSVSASPPLEIHLFMPILTLPTQTTRTARNSDHMPCGQAL